MKNPFKSLVGFLKRLSRKYSIYVLTLIIVALAFITSNFIVPKPKVAVIEISGSLYSDDHKNAILEALDIAKKEREIKAVVLSVNSPGGAASLVEEIFFKVLEVQEEKPVVASIDAIGASGAYYIACASHYIFAKTSSHVGGIGVIAEIPKEEEYEDVITSGPFKYGRTYESVLKEVDHIKGQLLKVIETNRELKIDPIELSSGRLYIGLEAKGIGLVDEIGSLSDAINMASIFAGLRSYDSVKISKGEIESIYALNATLRKNVAPNTGAYYHYIYVNVGEDVE